MELHEIVDRVEANTVGVEVLADFADGEVWRVYQNGSIVDEFGTSAEAYSFAFEMVLHIEAEGE